MFLSQTLDSSDESHRHILDAMKYELSDATDEDGQTYRDLVALHCPNRKLFRTENDRLGMGPTLTKKGDKVCIFAGRRIPFLIRQSQEDGKQVKQLVGSAYVHGYVFGEKRYEAVVKDEIFVWT